MKRSTVVVAGAAVFVAVLSVGFGLVAVGRGDRNGSPRPTVVSPSTTTTSVTVGSPVSAGGSGVSGAVSSTSLPVKDAGDPRLVAERYVEVLGSAVYLADDDAADVLGALVSERSGSEVEVQVAALAKKRSRFASVDGRVWQVARVFASRTVSSSDAGARVDVWFAWFTSASELVEPIVSWNTASVDVVVEDGEWRVARYVSSIGPTPSLGVDVTPASGVEFDAAMSGMGLSQGLPAEVR